jgi:predicted dehydrogenase
MGKGDGMRMVQIGVGGFGRRWAALVRGSEAVELTAIVDPAEAARAWAVANLELAPGDCLVSLDEALARTDWEAALVVTPPQTHHAVATAALRAGKHVLIEKPLATTLSEARALVETAAECGRTLMVSQNYRFRRPARAVQGMVAAGVIGDVLAVKLACRRDTRLTFPPGDFRYRMRQPYLLDMAIHHLDLLRALTGRDVRKVFARSWRVPDSPYLHDPALIAVLTLDCDVTVAYEGDWAAHGRETSWNGEWELVGERGRILWTGGEEDATRGDIRLQHWGDETAFVAQPPIAAADQAGTLRAFVDAVAAGREPETSAADNLRSLAAVLACVESIERGEAVAVAAG